MSSNTLDLVLHCPNCHQQHIDAAHGDWTNPPHRSHLCEFCGHIWRPADVPTNGVGHISTKGQNDSPILRRRPVIQPWVSGLTFMQQSVLLTALRAPDGLPKNHVSKRLMRWLRRCVLYSAFDGEILREPFDPNQSRGGSFTGASINSLSPDRPWSDVMHGLLDEYLYTVDEMPHHFQLHFMHASEIIGYKHPDDLIRTWWYECYCRIVNDAHLTIEDDRVMDIRLGDNERDWRRAEEVTAK